MNVRELQTLTDRAARIRHRVLDMAATPDGAHVGGSLSATDVLTVLYTRVLRYRPDEPQWLGRDHFILSKGHASAALYAILADTGHFPVEECATYGQAGGRLAGHPLRRVPGVEFPTGSLGHGLSLGIGLALAARRDGRDNQVFVLLGDGELQEGSVWEAVMCAAHFDLDNLTAIVDRNGLQITGRTEDTIALEPLGQRWASFGWSVSDVDGHDLAELSTELERRPEAGRPRVLIARTVKGRDVPLFENAKKSHHITLTPRLYDRAVRGLRARTSR